MKKSSLFFVFLFGFMAHAQSQDGGGRILEMLVRGLAHAVASDNGSHIVPPQIPYNDPHAGHRHAQQPTQNRSWYQQPQPQPQPRVTVPAPQPRVVRQPSQPIQSNNPFAGMFRPSVTHPQVAPQQRPAIIQPRQAAPTAPQSNGFSWFQQQDHSGHHQQGHHDHHNHKSHHQQPQPKPGWFSPREPAPSQHSSHGHHRQHHSQPEPQQQQKVIAIRSQFQPFAVFQPQQNATTVRGRVQQAPNQGSIVWFRSR